MDLDPNKKKVGSESKRISTQQTFVEGGCVLVRTPPWTPPWRGGVGGSQHSRKQPTSTCHPGPSLGVGVVGGGGPLQLCRAGPFFAGSGFEIFFY